MTILELAASDSLSGGCKSFSYQSSLAINHQGLQLLPVDGTWAIHGYSEKTGMSSFKTGSLSSEHRKKLTLPSG